MNVKGPSAPQSRIIDTPQAPQRAPAVAPRAQDTIEAPVAHGARVNQPAATGIRPVSPADVASAAADIASSTQNPDVARIFSAASAAASKPTYPQLRLAGSPEWPDVIRGVVRRHFDHDKNVRVVSFVPSQDTGLRFPPIELTLEQARGIANETPVTLERDRTSGNLSFVVANPERAFTHSMLARVEKRGADLVAVAIGQLSAYADLKLRNAGDVKVGDTIVAEVQTGVDGKPFAIPDSAWTGLTPERIEKLGIVIDEAGIDVVIPENVRNEVTAMLAAKPLTLEALTTAGYKDLTHIEFYSTDNPDSPKGFPSKDIDQAVAIEPREGGGYTIYRALADPGYFIDYFPEDGERSATAQRALDRPLTAYFHPDDAPIYDRRLSEGAVSLNAGEVRASFVMKMEVDAKGHLVTDPQGKPKVEIMNAAVNVRQNGNYWDSQAFLDGGDPKSMSAGYKAFWTTAKQFADLCGVKPHDDDELESQAIESYFSKLANTAIATELESQMKQHGLFSEDGPKFLSRQQDPPDPAKIAAYKDLVAALGLRMPRAPELDVLAHDLQPEDDRWPAVVKALGLPDNAEVARVYDALADVPLGSRYEDDLVATLWTSREQIRALIAEHKDDPQLYDVLNYNFIRKQRRASVSATTQGHFDVGRRHYGWVTAPMRRSVDAVNMALWRALNAGDLGRAGRILKETPDIARSHERTDKRMSFIAQEIGRIETAKALLPFVSKKGDDAHLIKGWIRHISMEGVEVGMHDPQVNQLIPMKFLTKRLGDAPMLVDDGTALEIEGRIVAHVAQEVEIRVDAADPVKRKVFLDIVGLGSQDR